jgi:hypothetical protein
MNSFISNFRHELTVLATVAAVLAVSEAAVRLMLPRVSADWKNFDAIERLAHQAPVRGGQTVLFVGNSLTGRGIDPSIIEATMQSTKGVRLTVEKAATDDSNIGEWVYLVSDKFTKPTSRPDLLVIGYAEDQLSDRAPVHVDRLAGYYGGLRIAPGVFRDDVHDFGSRTDYVISSFSALYANRDRIRTQVMDRMIPSYRSYAQQRNLAEKVVNTIRPASSHERLQRLLAICRQHSIPVALAAMPIPYMYRLDEAVPSLAREYGAAFFDMTTVPAITPSHFSDGYHLDDDGRRIYSQAFALSLAESDAILPPFARDTRQPSGRR